MGYQRDLAIMAMKLASQPNDFMHKVEIPMPETYVPGALPAMTREMNDAQNMRMMVDVVILFGIGDFDPKYNCSTYYDPSSPWYNVFYGAYAIRSYERDGSAWGYDADWNPRFDEVVALTNVDYNFLTAAQFGCPGPRLSFSAKGTLLPGRDSWDVATVSATVPSGLHNPTKHFGNPRNYFAFGIPDPSFLEKTNGESFEPVKMKGLFHMCPIKKAPVDEFITLLWGAACPATPQGEALLKTIVDALSKDYLPLSRYRYEPPPKRGHYA